MSMIYVYMAYQLIEQAREYNIKFDLKTIAFSSIKKK